MKTQLNRKERRTYTAATWAQATAGEKPGHTLAASRAGAKDAKTVPGLRGQGPAGRLAGLSGSHVPGVEALVTANVSQQHWLLKDHRL